VPRGYRGNIWRLNTSATPRKNPDYKNTTPQKIRRKKISNHEFEFGRYQFQVGDLVRRYQVGEPEQMFMYDVKNVGVVVEVISGKTAEVHVHWQLGKRLSYYSIYAAEKTLQLIARVKKSKEE